MNKIIMPDCFNCKHFKDLNEDLDKYVCDAFPTGIPNEIIDSKTKHIVSYPNDHGIQFEKKEE